MHDKEALYCERQDAELVGGGRRNRQPFPLVCRICAFTVNQAQKTAQEMYRRMFAMKFLPPGRGLWAMGSKLTTERRLYAALNNCAFVSTKGEL